MRAQLTPPSPRRRVRFRTPEEEVLVAALNGALLLALWPLFFSIRLALLGERLAAQVLGVYFGVLQGMAYAAAALTHILLSCSGLRRLMWGWRADMARLASVPIPGTPPRAGDAHTERHPSDALHAAITAALAATAPAAEPAVPQPLTPPVVAAAAPSDGGLPPALSAEAPASPAASEPAPAAGEWRQQVRQLAGEGAQQRRLDEELPPLHEDQLLAAFEPKGAAAKQAAQAWLQASEPSPILEPQAELQAPPAATPGPAAEKRRRDESGEGSPASPQAASPAGPDEGTAGAAPTGSRPPRSPSAYSAGSGSSPGRPSLPAVPEAVGTGAFVRSGSSGLSGRLGSGHSGGRLSAERLSSYPLPDLELDQQGDSGEEEPPPFAATASEAPVASGRTPGLAPVGGLAAAAAEGAAASLRAAHMEGLSLAGVSVGDTGSLDAEREDSLEITRHTKREKR